MISLLLLVSLFLTPSSVLAVNASITCDSSACTKSTGTDPLFYEENILPGFSVTRSVDVINNRTDNCNLYYRAYNPRLDILADKIFITDSTSTRTLSQFVDSTNYHLGLLAPGQTTTYSWRALFDPTAGNEYQNKRSVFDLDFIFECDSTTTTTSGDGGTTSSSGPPTCSDTTPQAPTNFRLTRIGSTAYLYWDPPASGSYTGYVLTYGPNDSTFLYGDPNVPISISYVVHGLNTAYQYCFKIRAQNGCAPGLTYSNTRCTNTSGIVSTSLPQLPGFQPGVLGEQTTSPPPSTTGEVGGVTTSACQRYWLPILYFIALVINLLYLHRQAGLRPDNRSIWRYFLPPVLSLFLYWVDLYILRQRCCLIVNTYCRYFWIGNVLSSLVPVWFYNKIKEK